MGCKVRTAKTYDAESLRARLARRFTALLAVAMFGATTMGTAHAAVFDNSLWLGNNTESGLGVLNTDTSGNVLRTLPATPATGFAIDLETNTIYMSHGGNRISSRNLDTLMEISGAQVPDPDVTSRIGYFLDMTFDGSSVWVADYSTAPTSIGFPLQPGTIRQIDPATFTVTSSFSPAGIAYPIGIAWDGSGFWISGCTTVIILGQSPDCTGLRSGYLVARYTAAGTPTGESFTFAGDLAGLAFDPRDNTLWIGGLGVVRHFTTGGTLLDSFAVEPAGRFMDGLEFQGTPTPDNHPPIANAGLDQAVHPEDLVTLDGSGSSDPDEDYPLTYAWEIASRPAGSTAILLSPDTVNPSFTPDLPGDYTISLVVTDARGLASAPEQVLVSTANTPPVAEAGNDQAILVIGSTVPLDGSQSYDEDGDPFTFQWTITVKPGGSAAILSGANTATPSFVVDVHGDYIISLTVTDILGATSAADTLTVSFNNVKPVANAGGNQAVLAGDTVSLDGSGSADANQDPLTYTWSIVSAPDGSTATLSSTTAVQTSFIADLPGNYVITLVVSDDSVDSNPSNVTIMAISRQSVVFQTLEETINTINGLDLGVLKNRNRQQALTNKINGVLSLVDQGLYNDALAQLEHDILEKTNGCAAANAPDSNDWITDCAAQQPVYLLITQAIALLLEVR